MLLAFAGPVDNMPLVQEMHGVTAPLDNMPLVSGKQAVAAGTAPVEKRDQNVWYYLQSSVRVRNGNVSGSATICHYDIATNTAYLISCGHLFRGNQKPNERHQTCNVEVFYKNLVKLNKPQAFPAEVICCDNDEDISFLKFHPDWQISHYFAIAPLDYPVRVGDQFESTGCDHAAEVASYTVEILEQGGYNLVTKNNSPRPGRSGGALLSSDGFYVGVVWGTSDYDGTGTGYYVPLKRIYAYAKQYQEVSWLLDVGKNNIVHLIPIVDLDDPGRVYPKMYIPLP